MKIVANIAFVVCAIFFSTTVKSQKNYTDTIPLGGNAWVNKPAEITR